MAVVLYYSVLIAAIIGSVCYLRTGVRLLHQVKAAQEDQFSLRSNALWRTAIGAFGTILWVTVVLVSLYNHLSSGK